MSAESRSPSDELAIEVIVMWGECLNTKENARERSPDVLHVAYVAQDGEFFVGDEEATEERTAPDFLIDRAQIGVPRLPIVLRDPKSGSPLLVVPKGASIQTVSDQGHLRSASQLLLDGTLRSNKVEALPLAWAIAPGATAWLSYRGFTFVVRATSTAEKIDAAPVPDWKSQRFTFVSLAAHLFLLALFYYSPPKSSAMNNDAMSVRAAYLNYTLTPPELDIEPMPSFDDDEGAQGAPAAEGEVGQLGEDDAKPVKAEKTMQASPRSPTPSKEPPLTREQWADIARTSGIIKALNGAAPMFEGRFTSGVVDGIDDVSAVASVFGDSQGPSFGNGLSERIGNGHGGGGFARGTVGSGSLNTIGRGLNGNGTGRYGTGVGGFSVRPPGRVPNIRSTPPTVVGSLSKEVIRRTIRQHIKEVRFCYEQTLISKPDVQGRIAVRFIIGPTGAVQRAVVASSDLANVALEQCVTSAVARWSFPQPEGSGIVSVTYPFVLEQVGQ